MLIILQRYFNSQPHEEADRPPANRQHNSEYFNSQPHEEADEDNTGSPEIAIAISTHSLTKRLTGIAPGCGKSIKDFNSQPHEEADKLQKENKSFYNYFNSQPHEEADFLRMHNNKQCNISTHSLTKRLTS